MRAATIRAPHPMSPSLSVSKNTPRERLPELRERYEVQSLAVFGSYVRGEEHSASDVDVLVTFDEAPGLPAFMELERELSNARNDL